VVHSARECREIAPVVGIDPQHLPREIADARVPELGHVAARDQGQPVPDGEFECSHPAPRPAEERMQNLRGARVSHRARS
jgi:hypothetical protein